MASAITFLPSADAAMVSGIVLPVDGGLRAVRCTPSTDSLLLRR